MRILVCGGRDFTDREFLFDRLDREESVTVIITGAQRRYDLTGGADWLAIEWALKRQIPFIGHPARWDENPKHAGPLRNRMMIEWWKPKKIIAFPGHNGTRHMVDIGLSLQIPVEYAGW